MIEMFLRNGEPNSSVRMMLMNDRKPSPIISGEPQSAGRGALLLGQSWNSPVVGRPWQLEPPPQSGMPDEPTSDAPIMRITVPVTIGGKMRCSLRAGTKDMKISRNAQMSDVPVWLD